ncbi:MAG: hypothetical protein PHD04_00110 [Candidatus Pacebacteria bacterium]|nr:hypothetical protein [Candidatus Paceibacterota bacterium]
MKTTTAVGAAAALIIGFGAWYWLGNTAVESPAPLTADYKNATYIIEGQPVQLVDGRAETAAAPGSASTVATQYFGNEAVGDLNGDGLRDIAFLLTQDPGGTGTFFFVVAAIKTADGYQGTSAVLLGDRIAPQTTEIREGTLIVNYAERRPDDPMTAPPSVGVSKYLKLDVATMQFGEVVQNFEGEADASKGGYCTADQRKADVCTQDYSPVCATVNIQCIKAPCNPIQQTFSNSCNACKNSLVSSYLVGECK